jgi:uncharacterized iron-regulated membrane protein
MPVANPRLRRQINLAHRHLGLVAALIVALLALTGLLLNHAEDLDFLEHPVRSELLLDWYGLSPDGELASFPAGRYWAVGLERGIYVDARYVAASEAPLIGAAALDDFLVLATHDSLLLVTADGEANLIDRLQSESLPGELRRIGRGADGQLWVEAADGVHRADRDLLSWGGVAPSEPVRWSAAAELPPEQRRAVLESFRGEGLPLARVIADLHSGRILGSSGHLLMDGAALVLLLLTGSGFYNWRCARR